MTDLNKIPVRIDGKVMSLKSALAHQQELKEWIKEYSYTHLLGLNEEITEQDLERIINWFAELEIAPIQDLKDIETEEIKTLYNSENI